MTNQTNARELPDQIWNGMINPPRESRELPLPAQRLAAYEVVAYQSTRFFSGEKRLCVVT